VIARIDAEGLNAQMIVDHGPDFAEALRAAGREDLVADWISACESLPWLLDGLEIPSNHPVRPAWLTR
jgi:hypothetical protein